MSFGEDIAKRYGDEILRLAPISGVASFVVGVSLQASSVPNKSAWLTMAEKNYAYYWYFLDIIRSMKMGMLELLALTSLVAIFAFRYVIKKILTVGIRSQEDRLKAACKNMRELIGTDSLKDGMRLGYEKWYEQSRGRILNIYRFGVLCLGAALQTIIVAIFNGSNFDALLSIALILVSFRCAWIFGLEYYKAVLPKRVALDSSMGLISPNILKDLDEVS